MPVRTLELSSRGSWPKLLVLDSRLAGPETCGACTSRAFCDTAFTGYLIGGNPASCPQLQPFCNHTFHGHSIRNLCGETCGCGYCPPSPPPAPPLAPACDEPLDLAIVLDMSGSMHAWLSQALTFVRELVLNFVVGEGHARVGLVTFSDAAATRSPLTPNSTALLEALAASERRGTWGATNISAGLARGMETLQGPEARNGSVPRLVLLLTDVRTPLRTLLLG